MSIAPQLLKCSDNVAFAIIWLDVFNKRSGNWTMKGIKYDLKVNKNKIKMLTCLVSIDTTSCSSCSLWNYHTWHFCLWCFQIEPGKWPYHLPPPPPSSPRCLTLYIINKLVDVRQSLYWNNPFISALSTTLRPLNRSDDLLIFHRRFMASELMYASRFIANRMHFLLSIKLHWRVRIVHMQYANLLISV